VDIGDAQMALERMRGERMMDDFEDVALPMGGIKRSHNAQQRLVSSSFCKSVVVYPSMFVVCLVSSALLRTCSELYQ